MIYSDGTFSLQTRTYGDKVFPGEYIVTVSAQADQTPKSQLVADEFVDPKKSKLRANVGKDSSFDFTVEKKK